MAIVGNKMTEWFDLAKVTEEIKNGPLARPSYGPRGLKQSSGGTRIDALITVDAS